MSERAARPDDPMDLTGPAASRPAAHDEQPGTERHGRFTRRELGLFGLAGAVGAYFLDRADPMIRLVDVVNPFDEGSKAGSGDRLLLEPEKYEIDVAWLPEHVSRWSDQVVEQSERYRIDPLIPIFALAIESAGYTRAGSEANAKGLMQITPIAEEDAIAMGLIDNPDSYDIWDPATNIQFGVANYAIARDRVANLEFDRDLYHPIELIAAAYNGGFEGQSKPFASGMGMPAGESLVYSRDMLNMYRERNAPEGLTYSRWQERDRDNAGSGPSLTDLAIAEM